MKYILLNAENTLYIKQNGAFLQKNGFMTSLTVTESAPARLTEIASGRTAVLSDDPRTVLCAQAVSPIGWKEGAYVGAAQGPREKSEQEPCAEKQERRGTPQIPYGTGQERREMEMQGQRESGHERREMEMQGQRESGHERLGAGAQNLQFWVSQSVSYVYFPPAPPRLPFLWVANDPVSDSTESSFSTKENGFGEQDRTDFPKDARPKTPFSQAQTIAHSDAPPKNGIDANPAPPLSFPRLIENGARIAFEKGDVPVVAPFPYAAKSRSAPNRGDVYAFFATKAAATAFFRGKTERLGPAAVCLVLNGTPCFFGATCTFSVTAHRLFTETPFPTLRRHRLQTSRCLSTGKALSFFAAPTREIAPRDFAPVLFPVAFAEEVFCHGRVDEFLCDRLKPRAKEIASFLGAFCRVLPESESSALLLTATGRVCRLLLRRENGLVSAIEREDL